ncbi:phiSA1p31-related protein [Streptomyces cylindrosporus]|uniref:PhiSA1p31-related protein n=1 Tax=Streptomyces cylindrosporus TaxID=2927583 RepID=A0ABS9Y3E8_9ACTN|nr:phiSA1p31-related protein [Streptomyces cylindrosporus]MCI3271045.1 phiSA1p31-related protein [Streptomyces cylindrosporus]
MAKVETFTIGDTVRTTLTSVPKGTIAFGPFKATQNGPERYMVQREDGTAHSVATTDIRPHVVFKVGEEAEEKAMGRTVEIVAGPFKGISDLDNYVIKYKASGAHGWIGTNALRKKPTATVTFDMAGRLQESVRRMADDMDRAARLFGGSSYSYKGRTYSLDGEYEDRQGDVWKFNGKSTTDGTPLMDCNLCSPFRNVPLSDVLTSYGPLSRA